MATGCVTRWWTAGGSTPASWIRCSRATGLYSKPLESRVDGEVDAASQLVGRVVIEEGARIINSTVRGPAIIGKRTVLRDTYVGPYTSIFHDCEVSNTEIEHSIVLEHSVISDIPRLSDSLIGKEAKVRRSGARPRANRLMVGDHSVIDLE